VLCLPVVSVEMSTIFRTIWKSQFLTLIPIGVLLMLVDCFLREQINYGNPFFLPVFEFSLPVLLVDFVTIIALSIAIRKWKASLLPP